MRTIITITKNPASTSEYHAAVQSETHKSTRMRAGNEPSAAAAKAVELAIAHGSSGYHIFAPQEVMDCIPADMRTRS